MIRSAVEEDKLHIIRLMKDFYASTNMPFEFHPGYAESLFRTYMTGENTLLLVLDRENCARGIFLAHTYEHDFGPFKVACEKMWWVDSHVRGMESLRMMEAYEQWAKDQGCQYMNIVSFDDERTKALYLRRGFTMVETHYMKAI